MLVVLAIMGVVLTTILLNQSNYTEKAALTNVADNISSTISQAQAYGIAVKERTPGSSDFSSAYGLSLSILDPSYTTSYLFFVDRNANGAYDGDWTCATGGTAECLEKTVMSQGVKLSSICTIPLNGNANCSAPKRVDITYLRPNPKARLAFYNSSGTTYDPGTNVVGARFNFTSQSGLTRSVWVYQSGQISVQ